MRIRRVQRAAVFAAGFAMAVGGTALASAATVQPALVRGGQPSGIQHVLLISVDGLHQQDLTWYVDNYPDSTLATLDHEGLEYSDAKTPFPSWRCWAWTRTSFRPSRWSTPRSCPESAGRAPGVTGAASRPGAR